MLWMQFDNEQLEDVLAFEIIPRLSLLDAQSLGQTCRSLRYMLKTDLLSATFRILANKTFPPGHPILAVDDANLQAEIEKLAATHASIRSGHPARVSTFCFPPGGRRCDTAIVLNHAGDYALRGHNHELELLSCTMNAQEMSMELVWKQAAPANDENVPRIFWSRNDRRACIWYDLWRLIVTRHYVHARSTATAICFWDLDKNIFQVMTDLQMDKPQDPCFSPDSSIVLIPWRNVLTTIDIFSWSKHQIIARVRDPWSPFLGDELWNLQYVSHIRFSPDSLQFAVTCHDHVMIYSQEGILQWVFHPDLGHNIQTSHGNAQIAWSPTGSRIAYWHPATTGKLHIGHVASGLEEVFELAELAGHYDFENCAGLLWGLYGPLPVFEPHDVPICLGEFSSMQLGLHWTENCVTPPFAIQLHPYKQQIGECMPALSPDGRFIAALADDRKFITIHDAYMDCVIFRAMAPQPKPERHLVGSDRASLAWASSGRRLVLQLMRRHYVSCCPSDALQPELVLFIIQF